MSRSRSKRLVGTVAAFVAMLVLPNCGDDPAAPGTALPTLTLSRDAAPMAAPLLLTGFDTDDVEGKELGVTVGGKPAPVRRVDGGLLTAVPIFLQGGAAVPPAGAVDVTLLADGVPVAERRGGLGVDPLPAAPGASAEALALLTAISDALIALVDASEEVPGPEGQYLFAVSRTVQELVAGDDPLSFASQLALTAADPDQQAILDGWLVASGMLAALEHLTGFLGQVAPDFAVAASVQGSGRSLPNFVSDVGLAYRMQLYEVALLFGQTVVAPTATTYSNLVGTGAAIIGLLGPTSTAVNIIGAVVAVTDFMINKVAVGLLPAKVDAFTMTVTSALLDPGEVTDAAIRVVASNDPPPIGVQDLVGLVLAGLGAIPAPEAQTIREHLTSVASTVLSLMQSFLAQYASANPQANLDVTLITVPAMSWEATIADPRMVDLLSTDPGIVAGLAGTVNWQASAVNQGQANISARSAIGPLFLSLPPGFTYTGGVFGDDVVQTDPTLVEVGGNFGGNYVGTYAGTGGCEGQAVGGQIAFTIAQTGLTLDVGYSINPDVEGLTIFGGQATIVTSTSTTFSGTITQPPEVTGTFTGMLSEDRTTISGTVDGSATVLCNSVPTAVGFAATYQGVRQ